MVATRSTASTTPRRRSLATNFDDAATRHALTPNTPAATATPVANSTTAVFVATANSLARDRFDESVAKHVIFRADANKLLFSTLELIFDLTSPATDWLEASAEANPHDGKRVLLETARMLLDAGTPYFQGTHELLRVRFLANVDPHADIINFNAALASASSRKRKRKNTLDNEELKGLYIDALDKLFYAAVVNRLMLTDQRAAVDLNTIQLWTRQCYASNVKAGVTSGFSAAKLTEDPEEQPAIADLTSIILDLKPEAANKREFGSRNFNVSDFENDHYAEQFQCAMENDDYERFNARCFLAGASRGCATSFRRIPSASPSVVRLQHSIDGAYVGTTETPPLPPLSDDGTDVTADDRVYPAADTVHFDNQTFADIIARGPLAVQHEELHLKHAWMIDDDVDNNNLLHDSGSDEEDASEAVADARRSVVPCHGVCRGGALPPSFRTALIHICIAALFCLCATAAPLTGQALGGAPMDSFGDMPADTGSDAVPAAIPPRKQIRYRQTRQGFERNPVDGAATASS
ncbi:hypothetical protein CYMTET_41559 [Cymbomonas tetramitiformis]|uniref:Uncharacterized protein n=1 Tax=Cymbomonas tetramitiformis TaxID=36881 RepID=A0AAE0C7T6_9CHLO|nr:hypothetical protein CYMTET_41559 [Cymbomonas tetramitiformis]